MADARVAVVRTEPSSVLYDCGRAMRAADYSRELDPSLPTALKVNLSWHHFYPACSTTPWQLEGVTRALLEDAFDLRQVYACHNRTVVVSARRGEVANRHRPVVRRYGIGNVHLYDPEERWVHIADVMGGQMDRFLALNRVYPDGFYIPYRLLDSNIIHLPTVKTHVFTTITGAMKNAFGALLNERRHWAHERIHEVLVDLLMIQKKIHSGLFAVMDGTWAGDGPGPRCLVPHEKNVMLASADQVAIDAVAAKLMGFDPMEDIKFIRLAHERGLGCGDPDEIEIVGDPGAAEENWNFQGPYRDMTFASRMQHAIYWGGLKDWLHWTLQSCLAPWSYVASFAYHDCLWYPLVGRRRVYEALQGQWGELFRYYQQMTGAEEEHPEERV